MFDSPAIPSIGVVFIILQICNIIAYMIQPFQALLYLMAVIVLIQFAVLILVIVKPRIFEAFELPRERAKGKDIPIGTLPNTPAPLKDVMKDLNIVGNQIEADSEYDRVDSSILNKAK